MLEKVIVFITGTKNSHSDRQNSLMRTRYHEQYCRYIIIIIYIYTVTKRIPVLLNYLLDTTHKKKCLDTLQNNTQTGTPKYRLLKVIVVIVMARRCPSLRTKLVAHPTDIIVK